MSDYTIEEVSWATPEVKPVTVTFEGPGFSISAQPGSDVAIYLAAKTAEQLQETISGGVWVETPSDEAPVEEPPEEAPDGS